MPTPSSDPLFILGTERSGSNLLRLLLHGHSRIAMPHPPHIVRYFAPIELSYGELSSEAAFGRLVDDVLRLLRTHIYPWDLPIDRARVVREAAPRNVFGIYVALYDQYREASGRARWGCKSTFMIEWVPAILARFPGARLIYLVRDPRDVAASSRLSIFSSFHPWYTAHLWADQQRLGLRWLDTLPAETIRLIRYEDLVTKPEPTLRALCEFIGEAFEPAMLRFFETDEARRSATLSESWSNTGRPIHADSVGRFRSDLDDREILIVEAVARDPMTRLGYEPVNDTRAIESLRVGRADRLRYWCQEQALRLRLEARSLVRDRNAALRWRRGALLAWLHLRARLAGHGG